MASEARPSAIHRLAPPRSRAKEKRSSRRPPTCGGLYPLKQSLSSTAQSLIHINPPTRGGVGAGHGTLPADGSASDGRFTGRGGQLTESGMLSEQTVRTRNRAPRAVISVFDPHQCTLRRQRCCIPERADPIFWVSRSTLGKKRAAQRSAPPRDQKPTGAAAQTTMGRQHSFAQWAHLRASLPRLA